MKVGRRRVEADRAPVRPDELSITSSAHEQHNGGEVLEIGKGGSRDRRIRVAATPGATSGIVVDALRTRSE